MANEEYNKEELAKAAIETSDLKKIEEKVIAKTILDLLLEGHTKHRIIERLEISESTYTRLMKTTLTAHEPLPEDVHLERQLAHQRYLTLLLRFQRLADEAETPNQEAMMLKEIRSTVKEIGDIYSIKLPTKLEMEVNINHKADDIAKQLIQALRPSQDLQLEETIEVEVIETKDLGTKQLEQLEKTLEE